MGFMDEYYKALKDDSTKSSSSGSGSSGGGKSSGSSFMDEYNKAVRTTNRSNSKNSVYTRDIAPLSDRIASRMTVRNKKKKKKEEERSWFKKGLFDDGYDIGDISRTILGSTTDVLENVGSGIIGMGEKAVDAMAYIAPFAENAQFYQNGGGYNPELQKQHEKVVEQSKKDLGKFISKDLYDEEKIARAIISDPARKIGIDSESHSVFGEKSDALIQSGGQLLATAGMAAAGLPWWATTGVTSFGSEAENAMNQGANYEQAGASAAISAGAEILSEKLSGGISFGGKTLDDSLTKMLARGISDKLGRTAAKLGMDMVGEGAEEVFSQVASNLGSSLYKEEDITDLLFSEEAFDEYLESFIGGAALGGVAGGYNAVKSNRSGVDYASGLTENEQKVVDKLYKDEIANREGKVSQKEKSKIYDSIIEDMEKGYISIDTIEEVLGGESYSAYKNTVDSEDAILKEYDELGEKQNATPKDYARYTELTEKVKNIHSNSQRNALRAKLNEEVMGLVKGDRLAESYNERVRSSQKYEADVTKYDAKQQAVVQKAIDSGILNNSNRTHEFVDFVSKISADTGVLFDFSNTEKIREAGFAVEGQTVDGFITKDGITVNIDSPKSRQFVVGHEITHALEGTELYGALRQSVFDYAKMKNQYDARMESIQKRYKEGTDFEAELTADLVGEYIFSDTDFINNLSTQNRNVFQKVYDEIKYLCKVATAGSKEARELEKVKRAFEKAYREGGKTQGETKYSVSDSAGKELTAEQQEYFKDSKARDENGNLIKVYHSSPTAGFTVFDGAEGKGNYKYGDYGDGITFFTDNKAMADSYSPNGEMYEGYLNIKKPYEIDARGEKWSKIPIDAATKNFLQEYGASVFKEDGAWRTTPADIASVIEEAVDNGDMDYDGIIIRNIDDTGSYYKGKDKHIATDYIVFNSNQFKNADNTTPTEDKDFRFSLSDNDYLDAVNRGDMEAAQQMVNAAAKAAGYSDDMSWKMQHSAPNSKDDISLVALKDSGLVPNDYWDHPEWYTYGAEERESFYKVKDAIRRHELRVAKGKDYLPTMIWVYRAVDKTVNAREGTFRNGDWVTPSRAYAENEGQMNPKGYRIIKDLVPIKDLYWDGNSIAELGYDDGNSYAYADTKNNRKLLDPVTYDDAGNVIPLSKRFKKRVDDTRYSLSNVGEQHRNAIVSKTTNDIVEEALQDGSYDGVIIKNVIDYGGHAHATLNSPPGNDYIVFNSKQFKAADNLKPTADPDIRFSLSNPVEETKDLVALHNLTTDKLMKSLELGGLPMPSLAITKADIPHSNFGEITLVFGSETIDPKANRKNKVYSADAWTPVFPRTEYESDINVERRISQRLSGLESKVDDYFSRDLRMWQGGLEDYLNREGGEEGLVQKALRNYGLKAAYLEEQGNHIAKVTKQEQAELGFNPSHADKYQQIMDILGVTTAEEIGKVNLKDARDNHGAEIETLYPGFTKSPMRLSRLFSVVKAYVENKDGKVSYNTVTDGKATQQAVDDALDSDGYEAWIRNLFSGIVKDSGIYNNKELFTPSGNRRTFKQTHLPVTLENIVKAMASQNSGKSKNVSGFNGVKTLRASTAETFKSVAQMHQRKGRLQNLTQEQFEALTDDLESRLYKAIEAIDNENGQRGGDNSLIRYDVIGEILTEIGESGKYTAADIQKTFRNYSKNVSDDTALAVKQLLDDVAQMPVNIFEAKPERVVGFDEAKVFVIPYDADVKLKQELLNRGYSIAEYDPKVEGDRQRVVNQFEEYKFSLSNVGEQHTSDSLSALRLDAPVAENATVQEKTQLTEENSTVTAADMQELFPDDGADVHAELEDLQAEEAELRGVMEAYAGVGDIEAVNKLIPEHDAILERIKELQQHETERADSLTEADAPEEMDAPFSLESKNYDPFEGITEADISRSTRSYSDRNPGARRFLEEAALGFGYDVNNSTRGERWYNDQLYYESGGEQGFGGTARHTTPDIADLKDTYGYTWDDLRKAADDVANGDFRSVAAKRVEYLCHKRLMEGYTDVDGRRYEPNQEYISFLNETFADEQRAGSFDSLLENADQYVPAEDIAPVKKTPLKPPGKLKDSFIGDAPIFEGRDGQTTMFAPEKKTAPSGGKTANVLTNEPKTPKRRSKFWSLVKEHVLDNGMVFEDLSKETGNRKIEAKWNFIRYSQSRAQRLIGNGSDGVKALKDIKKVVDKSGKTGTFYDYLYHKHNVDRMTLEDRFDNTPNKAVFGDSVTAEMSQRKVNQYEKSNPEFMQWADDVYGYMNHLRGLLVENGVISQETADLWEKMYPHYVPIRRAGQDGVNINVPLDSRKTTVNNPIKRATGGNQDILPLFDTMAQRTIQTYKAIARNSFGIELKNQLGSVVDTNVETVDDVIDGIDTDDALLKPGEFGSNPTFTVFENGERVEFEITEEMYDAMKPKSEALQYRNKILNTASGVFRGLTTQYSIPFMATNAIKDAQDVLINSQHPAKTYANFPRAWWQQATNGKWYQEYIENGGEDNTYFDNETNVFKEDNWFMKGVKLPFDAISAANNFIELTPRLSEYIASREAGRSIEVSMLDAARVTTNFAAGGDLTKFLNSNGATFLNASVQGAIQQARNIREAHHKGLKGYVGLATRFALAGLPAVLLNNMLWDDDEDYEELADYVKQDYYVIAKYGDGKFIRIPKGRTVAVIQNAIEQIQNVATGDDEADFGAFLQLAVNNLAPNNPLENNIIAPIRQVAKNQTWYGEELIPSRLQDLPAAEQFDEKTDDFSKWLGEKLDVSPYKINYLLNQYSGGLGDLVLPMMTPRAESGDDSLLGTLTAPLRDKFTTDSVINSQVVSDYYDTKDALKVKANSKDATDEDMFREMYMDSVGWEMSDLYKQKREIQNSDMPDSEKYAKSRDLQEQIVERMREALASYDDIHIDGKYATVGDKRFDYSDYSGKWYEIEGEYLEKEQKAINRYGITPSEYWNNTDLYYHADKYFDDKYANNDREFIANAVFGGKRFAPYAAELNQIKGEDKNGDGKTDSGSKKDNIIDYINGLDMDYGEKIIMFRTLYSSKADKKAYNMEIINYLNSRDDISYQQMKSILEELDMEVDSEGNITW